MAAAAVALAVGAVLRKLGDQPRSRFVALGVGYGVLALIFVIGGSIREQQTRRALADNSFTELPGWSIAAVAVYISALVALTVIAIL